MTNIVCWAIRSSPVQQAVGKMKTKFFSGKQTLVVLCQAFLEECCSSLMLASHGQPLRSFIANPKISF
jgi:hypothetical protein